jgi:hypothetical protein
MNNTSKTDAKMDAHNNTRALSHNVEGERLDQTVEGVTSLDDLPTEFKKKKASKPIYLIRYE